MPKYINAKDLILEVSHYLQCEKESKTITLEELNEIANRLPPARISAKRFPSDIVKVVRCKDCKYYDTNYGGRCEYNGGGSMFLGLMYPTPNDYCNYGERRERK